MLELTPEDRRTFRMVVFQIVFFGTAIGAGLVSGSGEVGVASGLAAGLVWALGSARLLRIGPPDSPDSVEPAPDDAELPPPRPARRPVPDGRTRLPQGRRARRRP